MNLDPKLVTWLTFSLLAVVILARMMDTRRAKLVGMLQNYVQERLQWARKRARAARLTQRVAQKKAAEEAQAVGPSHAANSTRNHPAPSSGATQSPSVERVGVG